MNEQQRKHCQETHHPWQPCPECEYCGEAHCSLNAMAHEAFNVTKPRAVTELWPPGKTDYTANE